MSVFAADGLNRIEVCLRNTLGGDHVPSGAEHIRGSTARNYPGIQRVEPRFTAYILELRMRWQMADDERRYRE